MVFKICAVEGDIPFDALPVGKIIDYPLEERDYRPFTQFQIAFNKDGMHLKLWAFEVNQTPNSKIKAIFNLNPSSNSYFELTLNGDYSTELRIFDNEGMKTPNLKLEVHHMDGEDLQGIYWGASILVPSELIDSIFGKVTLDNNSSVLGNIFKLNELERPHYGSYFPVDFKSENPYNISAMREIPIFVY